MESGEGEVEEDETSNEGVLNDLPPEPTDPERSSFNPSQLPIIEGAFTFTVGINGSRGPDIATFIEEEFLHSSQGIFNETHFARRVDSFNINISPTFNNELVPG